MGFNILGTGSALPDKVVTNDGLTKILDTSDAWITSKTGIKTRRVITDETLTGLASDAANKALADGGVSAKDLDLIICATLQGDCVTPSLSCAVQEQIGAHCPAVDINAACSGLVYAMDIAAGYYARKRVKKVLIVCAEAMSRHVDWTDRATCVLFGDGAGAVLLDEGDALLSIGITAKGDAGVMHIPCGHVSPYASRPVSSYLRMNGQEVYRFAVSAMENDLKSMAAEAGLTVEDIDYILPHQANLRIINTATAALKLAEGKVLTNIEHYGNMSSASIAVLLDEMSRAGRFKKGDILAFAAFGGGLTTGACLLKWTKS